MAQRAQVVEYVTSDVAMPVYTSFSVSVSLFTTREVKVSLGHVGVKHPSSLSWRSVACL